MFTYLYKGKFYQFPTAQANPEQAILARLNGDVVADAAPPAAAPATTLTQPSLLEDERPSDPPPPQEPDNLTTLYLLGKAAQEQLNNAGIFTFADLAAADPDVLETKLRASRTHIEGWIKDAQDVVAQGVEVVD